MLSRIERNYLSGKLTVSKSYGYILDHRIRYKVKQFLRLELPLIMQNENLTEFYNDLTENNNVNLENIKLRTGFDPATFTLPR